MSKEPIIANSSINSNDDFIDFIDVIALFWRARWALTFGILAGIVIAYFAPVNSRTTVFLTSIPVKISSSVDDSLSALTARFNKTLQRPDIAEKISSTANMNLTPEDISQRLSLKLSPPKSLSLEWTAKDPDPTGSIAKKIAMVTAEVTRAESDKIRSVVNSSVSSTKAPPSDLELQHTKLIAAELRELAPIKVKLFSLSANLSKSSRKSDSQQHENDDVLQLLAYSQGPLPEEENARIISEYAQLNAEIDTIHAKFEQPKKVLSENLRELSNDLIEKSIGPKSLFPTIFVDENAYATSVSIGTHELLQKGSNKLVKCTVGAVLGALIALLVYLIVIYFVRNQQRLRTAFKNEGSTLTL